MKNVLLLMLNVSLISPLYAMKTQRIDSFSDLPEEIQIKIFEHAQEIELRDSNHSPDIFIKNFIKFSSIDKKIQEKVSGFGAKIYKLDFSNLYTKSHYKLSNGSYRSIIKMCPNLRALSLWSYEEIADCIFRTVADLSHLTFLELVYCEWLLISNFGRIQSLKNLTSFHAIQCGIGDYELGHLKKLPLLSLKLTFSDQITKRGLNTLFTFTNLTLLSLSGCNEIWSPKPGSFSVLTNLTSLNLSFCDWVDDEVTEGFISLTKLIYLNLSMCSNVTNASVPHLGFLTNIKELYVCRAHLFTTSEIDSLKRGLSNAVIYS